MSTVHKRSEKKYLPGSSRYHLTHQTVEKFVPVYMFEKDKPVTHVRTTYYDNDTFDTYYDWLNREPIRYKVRCREYGYDGKFADEVWMELKIKNCSISQKKRFKINREHVDAFAAIYRTIEEEIPANAIIDLTALSGNPDYFFDHVHPNPTGTRAIAAQVAAFLADYLNRDAAAGT